MLKANTIGTGRSADGLAGVPQMRWLKQRIMSRHFADRSRNAWDKKSIVIVVQTGLKRWMVAERFYDT